MTTQENVNSLTQTLHFDEADLRANAQGSLTEKQREHWQRAEVILDPALALLSVVVYGVLFYFLTFSLELSVGLFAVLLALMFAPSFWRSWRMMGELRAGKVEHISGEVSLTSALAPARRYSRQFFIVCTSAAGEKKRFPVKRNVQLSFEAGAHYQIFYLPDTLHMISASRL